MMYMDFNAQMNVKFEPAVHDDLKNWCAKLPGVLHVLQARVMSNNLNPADGFEWRSGSEYAVVCQDAGGTERWSLVCEDGQFNFDSREDTENEVIKRLKEDVCRIVAEHFCRNFYVEGYTSSTEEI